MRRALATVALAVVASGCLPASQFHCTTNDNCGPGGTCEPVGYCSFSDPACAGGQRFGDESGAYTHQCVGAVSSPDGGGGDSGVGDSSHIDGTLIDGSHVDGAPIPDSPPGMFARRINLAGPAYTGVDYPGAWEADPGVGGACNGAEFDSPTTGINGTNDSTLFRNQMFGGTMACAITGVPSGTYTVTLLFAELRLGASPCVATGSRVFDVDLEGTPVLTGFNMTTEGSGCAATGGPGHAFSKSFTVAVTDGTLNVDTTSSMGASAINAIELVQQP